MPVPDNRIGKTVTGERSIEKLFSKEQRAFLAQRTDVEIPWDRLVPLGPVNVLKLKQALPGFPYKVVAERSDSFALQSVTSSVLAHLSNPRVNFVIADTRQLDASQVNLLRPFFANLPEPEFNRVLRSFAFKQRPG